MYLNATGVEVNVALGFGVDVIGTRVRVAARVAVRVGVNVADGAEVRVAAGVWLGADVGESVVVGSTVDIGVAALAGGESVGALVGADPVASSVGTAVIDGAVGDPAQALKRKTDNITRTAFLNQNFLDDHLLGRKLNCNTALGGLSLLPVF